MVTRRALLRQAAGSRENEDPAQQDQGTDDRIRALRKMHWRKLHATALPHIEITRPDNRTLFRVGLVLVSWSDITLELAYLYVYTPCNQTTDS
jgi:hypothetical protein